MVGCCSTKKVNSIQAFRSKYPNESEGYYVIAPVSSEFLDFAADLHESTVKGLLQAISNRIENPDALRKFVARQMEWDYREDFAITANFKEKLTNSNGELFFFKYRKDAWGEDGLLILKDGKIIAGGAEPMEVK